MTKKASCKEVQITEGQAKDFKRMDLASQKYGISISFIKKLINEKKIHRFKLGMATMVDCGELEALIRLDVGNHGPQAAPRPAK